MRAFADRGDAGDMDVRDQTYAAFDLDLRPDDAIRPDLDAVTYARAVGNARSRIDHHLALGDDRADLGLGDEHATDFGLGPVPPHIAAVRDLVDVIFDGVARHRRLAEFGLVDGEEIHRAVFRAIAIWRRHSTPAVCAIPSIISTPGITGFSGKWPRNCGSLIVTFLMPIPCSSP